MPMDKIKEEVLRETFGIIRLKKSTQKILDESDKDAWN